MLNSTMIYPIYQVSQNLNAMVSYISYGIKYSLEDPAPVKVLKDTNLDRIRKLFL